MHRLQEPINTALGVLFIVSNSVINFLNDDRFIGAISGLGVIAGTIVALITLVRKVNKTKP